MRPHSLRLRLLLGAGLWVTLALVGAGAAIVLIFSASVERDLRDDLLASLDRLIVTIEPNAPLASGSVELDDPRYTVPAGGFYWQIKDLDTGYLAQSRSFWDFELEVPAPKAAGAAERNTLPGPQGQALGVLSQDILLNAATGVRHLRASVAENLALRSRDIRQFGADMAVALLAVGASLVFAAWLQVHLGLRPLRRLQHSVEAVAQGTTDKLPEDYPTEVLPLVREVNELLAGHERSIEFARARADDLAHGLKTPLAVLSATAGKLRALGDEDNATVLDMLSEEMSQRIDYQLRLSQLRIRSGARGLSASLDQALLRSVAVLSKTGTGEALSWQLDTGKLSVNMDPHDLMELIGVLLENAAKWARSQVRITCRPAGAIVEIEVSDDGPGLSDAEIARLGPRGRRLDEQRSGNGFGIAIAREILALNGGTMQIGRSNQGGLQLLLGLPLAADQSDV